MGQINPGNSHWTTCFTGMALSALMALTALPANAGHRAHRDGGYQWITAQSEFDFRTVSGPVRRGPVGDQVRLPGGTWMNCGYSCAYTLRTNTLDFFTCGEGGPNDCSPGILDDIIARRFR